MNLEADVSSFIERIPTSRDCCFCIPIRCGSKIIAILGIILGLSCATMFLLKDRKYLTVSSMFLISLLSIFIIITIIFVVLSVVLLVAVCDENPDLMEYYIWLASVYLCVQLILAIVIPLVLVIDGRYPTAGALIWMAAVMIIALGWVHFISIVNTYRMNLLYGDGV